MSVRYEVTASQARAYAWRSRPLLRLVRRFAPTAPACADVGAANGALGEVLRAKGLVRSYTGFELDPGLRQAARPGIEVRAFDAETDTLPGRYGLIICSHVMEHVSDPTRTLGRIAASLTDDGVMICVAPNAASLCHRIMGDRWIGHDDPTHITLLAHHEWREAIEVAHLDVRYAGSSYLSDLPWWGRPVALASKAVFFLVGYAPWALGNSSVFVASR